MQRLVLILSASHLSAPVCACRSGWRSRPPRDTRCQFTSCPERWTPVSICLSHADGDHGWFRVRLTATSLCVCVCVPGPVVGEFPAQNDVNLAPAPSLPQVMIIFIILNTSCSLQKRKITDSQCLSHQT